MLFTGRPVRKSCSAWGKTVNFYLTSSYPSANLWNLQDGGPCLRPNQPSLLTAHPCPRPARRFVRPLVGEALKPAQGHAIFLVQFVGCLHKCLVEPGQTLAEGWIAFAPILGFAFCYCLPAKVQLFQMLAQYGNLVKILFLEFFVDVMHFVFQPCDTRFPLI